MNERSHIPTAAVLITLICNPAMPPAAAERSPPRRRRRHRHRRQLHRNTGGNCHSEPGLVITDGGHNLDDGTSCGAVAAVIRSRSPTVMPCAASSAHTRVDARGRKIERQDGKLLQQPLHECCTLRSQLPRRCAVD
jgi:hypothetical protein